MKKTRIALVICAFGAAALLAATLALARTESHNPRLTDDMLVTASRDRLRICVEAVDVPQFDAASAIQPITAALDDVSQHPRWSTSGYGRAGGPVVAVGCPGEPYMLRADVEVVDGKPAGLSPVPEVKDASTYRLFVFVVPEEKLESVIRGNWNVRFADQEALCEGGVCFTVTNGIYVTPEELKDRAFLKEWLEKGLSLERPVPLGPPDNNNLPR